MLGAGILERVTLSLERLLASLSLELVDIEVRREGRKLVLCLYVDKTGGVTLDDCATLSHEASLVLDVEDIIPEQYTLEVSSPGLNRPLKKLADYERSIDKLVRIKTNELWHDEAGNQRKTFLGRLVEVSADELVVDLTEGQRAIVPMHMIAKANLEFEF